MLTKLLPWQPNAIDKQLIDLAFAEDLGLPFKDITTLTLFSGLTGISKAKIISKHPEPSLLCGLPVLEAILGQFNQESGECQLHSDYQDGDVILPGAELLSILAPAQVLLSCERILLNFLQRLCAVATITRKFVDRISHTQTKILDTRKTTPGFRHLEKYAVQCGGGVNHRMGLYDAIMVKDTHVDLLGGMSKALDKLPETITQEYPVIIEVRSLSELDIVLEEGLSKVSRVLLDNMSTALMQECVILCQGVMKTEASGNVDFETVAAIAETGVDFISIGKLTHSAGNIDLSMRGDLKHE